MLKKCFTVFAIVGLLMFVGRLAAEEKNATAHEGTVVKAGDGKLTMTGKADQKEHTHAIKPGTKIVRGQSLHIGRPQSRLHCESVGQGRCGQDGLEDRSQKAMKLKSEEGGGTIPLLACAKFQVQSWHFNSTTSLNPV